VRQVVARAELPLPLLAAFGSERVYEVATGDPARGVAAGRPASVVWRSGGATIDLGDPAAIEGVVFEIGDGPWIDRPRIWSSMDGRRWEFAQGEASLADAVVSLCLDPAHGLGAIRFPLRTARFVRLDPRVPMAPRAPSVLP
jgi:hypothetical protein